MKLKSTYLFRQSDQGQGQGLEPPPLEWIPPGTWQDALLLLRTEGALFCPTEGVVPSWFHPKRTQSLATLYPYWITPKGQVWFYTETGIAQQVTHLRSKNNGQSGSLLPFFGHRVRCHKALGHSSSSLSDVSLFCISIILITSVFSLDSFTTGRNYFLMALEEIVLSYPSKQNSSLIDL